MQAWFHAAPTSTHRVTMVDSERTSMKPQRKWADKFADAFRGLASGVSGQSSFAVHFVIAACVILAGFMLRTSLQEWCLLILCMTLVLAAEMFNSALEALAKSIDTDHNPHLAKALDIGSAAVLVSAIGSSLVGAIVFFIR